MAAIQGTNIVAPVVPLDTTDVYPTHEAQYGKGGYRVVSSAAQRDAIPAARREEGMLVFVTADSQRYRLGSDLVTWSTDSSGGGASSWNDLTGKPSTFPPSTHAASHGAAGSDPVTVTVGQVTGLQTALDGKASTEGPSFTTFLGNATFTDDAGLTTSIGGGFITTRRVTFSTDGAGVFQTTAFTGALKTKLDGIATGATANATDAQLRDRSTHTGTQALSTLSQSGATTNQVVQWSGTAWVAATIATYTLPNATTTTLGGVIVGTGLGVASGTVSVTYGTTGGTACQGNDSRLSDSRAPTGAAGGDLAGTYPNPQIAAGAVVTADLANSAVTYAKMQNVSATDRLLGRSTAGAGVVEEITCTAFGRSIIDDADATAARTTLGLATVASSGSAADLTGTLAAARLPAIGVSGDSITTGTVAAARLATHTHAAGDITSGTLPEGRLPNLVIIHPFLLAAM